MEGPPLGPGGEDITWPDQVAPRGRKASSTRKIKPQTSNLYSTLPIPHCANSVLYVDYTEMPKFRAYDFALVVACGLTRFTRVFPCLRQLKLHGQNHTKCTQFGPCKKIVFHRLSFSKTEY